MKVSPGRTMNILHLKKDDSSSSKGCPYREPKSNTNTFTHITQTNLLLGPRNDLHDTAATTSTWCCPSARSLLRRSFPSTTICTPSIQACYTTIRDPSNLPPPLRDMNLEARRRKRRARERISFHLVGDFIFALECFYGVEASRAIDSQCLLSGSSVDK